MERVLRRLLIFSILCGLLAPALLAADYLVVFDESSTARIYDANTFQLLGSPAVGPNGLRAFGIPDPANPAALLKIYVVTRDSVLILSPSPPFSVLATRSTAVPLESGRNIMLARDGSKLLMFADDFLQVFDTFDPSHPSATTLQLASPVTAVGVRTDSKRAYVAAEGTSTLRILGLNSSPPQFLGGPLVMPLDTKLLAPAPNGFAIYAFSEDTVFEIDPFANTFGPEITTGLPVPVSVGFDPDGPIDTAFFQQPGSVVLYDMPSALIGSSFFPASTIIKAVTPGQGLIYVLTEFNGVLSKIDTGTSILSPVNNPDTGFPFPDPAVDVAASPGGQSMYFAFGGSGSIAHIDASGANLLGQVNLPTPPTGLEVVSSPGAFGTSVEIYGGNQQLSGPGTAFAKPLTVRVLGPDLKEVFQQAVSFTSDEPGVIFNPPIAFTNLSGVAQTFATPPVTDSLQIQASIPDDEFVTFDMNSNAPGVDGLSKLEGDYQYILEDTPFDIPLVVGARAGGVPLEDLEITITSPSSAVTCPGPMETGVDGDVSFPCTANDVFFNSTVDIKVEDELGRELEDPFHVTVVPSAVELPGPINRLSSRGLVGEVGQFLPAAIRLKISSGTGFPVNNLGIRFESSDDDLVINPAFGVTDSQGFVQAGVTLGCRSRATITGTLNATGEQETEVSVRASRGPAVSATKTNGDNQSGNPGQELPVALVAVIKDICGTLVPGAPVVWDIQPPGSVTLIGAFGATNNVGQISARVQLGNTSQLILITARIGGAAATFRLETNVTTAQIVAIQGAGQTVAIGQEAMPLIVETRNSDGAPTGGVPVSFAVLGGSATLSSPETVSGNDGRASTGVRVGSQIGTVIIEARAAGLVLQFRLNVVGQLPAATALGFVNGASFQAGLVPGSAAAIFGTGLTQDLNGVLAADSAPFPTTLGGVRVFVAGVAAPIISIANVNGQEQLNIQVPATVPAPGTVSVMIDNNGAIATVSGVQMLAVQPGIFQVTLAEGLFAVALHPNFEFVGPTNKASPGGTVLLFVTGLGATDPPVQTNVPGPVPPAATVNKVTVTVDGVDAQVLGSFYAPFQYTLYQINLVIPPEAASGNLVIQVTINGVSSQQLLIPVG
jgi:uncharacterized protein (TIGR03437 family)